MCWLALAIPDEIAARVDLLDHAVDDSIGRT